MVRVSGLRVSSFLGFKDLLELRVLGLRVSRD
jgi:hypothetical protein